MIEAADTFQSNVSAIDELFSSFNTMLTQVISGTVLPWGDFADIWSEAQMKVASIMEKTKDHIEKLLKEVGAFVEELERVDYMASRMTLNI